MDQQPVKARVVEDPDQVRGGLQVQVGPDSPFAEEVADDVGSTLPALGPPPPPDSPPGGRGARSPPFSCPPPTFGPTPGSGWAF